MRQVIILVEFFVESAVLLVQFEVDLLQVRRKELAKFRS